MKLLQMSRMNYFNLNPNSTIGLGGKHKQPWASFLAVIFFLCSGFLTAQASPTRGNTGDYWADLVLGQFNYDQITPNAPTSTSLYNPSGVFVDRISSPNRMYVFDGGNNRILGLSDIARAYSCFGYDQNAVPQGADIVLGQSDFAHSACNKDAAWGDHDYPTKVQPDASCLCGMAQGIGSPHESHMVVNMAADNQGNLYVPDVLNNRVLRYDKSTLPSGAHGVAASYVWGQSTFNAGYPPGNLIDCSSPTNSNFCFTNLPGNVSMFMGTSNDGAGGVAIDSQGNLWVADSGNNRVLRFPYDSALHRPTTIANLVLGQSNFTSNAEPTTWTDKTHLRAPMAVRVDSAGNVFVADVAWIANNDPTVETRQGRILVYSAPLTSGMTARYLQSQYLQFPTGLEFDPAGGLWVNDYGTTQAVLFGNITPSVPINFTPTKVLFRPRPWTGSGTGLFASQGDTPSHTNDYFKYQDGSTRKSWAFGDHPKGGATGGIGIDSSGNVFLTGRKDINDVWGFPAPIPLYSNLAIDTAHSAKWAVFKPPVFGQGNSVDDKTFSSNSCMGVAVAGSGVSKQIIVTDERRMRYWNIPSGPSGLWDGKAADGFAGTACYSFGRIKQDYASPQHLWVIQETLDGGTLPSRIEVYNLPMSSGETSFAVLNSTIQTLEGTAINWQTIHGIAPAPDASYVWISDKKKSRVLRIRNPLGVTPGATPVVDIVLGQPDTSTFTGNYPDGIPSRNNLLEPGALYIDRFENLYVSDHSLENHGNSRILRFDATTIQNNTSSTKFYPVPASAVYGSGGNFSLSGCIDPTNGICKPLEPAIKFDNSYMVVGSNYYAEGGHRFPAILQNPLAGDTPYGHLNDYTAMPYSSVFDDEDNLYIGDYSYHRLLVYFKPLAALTPTPTLTPIETPVVGAYVKRVDVGNITGAPVTDSLGNAWQPDQAYTTVGSYGYINETSWTNGNDPNTITRSDGTTVLDADQTLYQSYRLGQGISSNECLEYKFDNVPPGTYQVDLKFNEDYCTFEGCRVFNVLANGATVVQSLDILKQTLAWHLALDKVFEVQVTGGTLDLKFCPTMENHVIVSAIQIIGLQPPPTPTPTFTPITTPVAGAYVKRVDVGNITGAPVTDSLGKVWAPDQAYDGIYGYVGGTRDSTSEPVTGSNCQPLSIQDQTLYQTLRYGRDENNIDLEYRFNGLSSGVYQVDLKFLENYFTNGDARIFNVVANGVTMVRDIDIYDETCNSACGEVCGKNRALDKIFNVQVAGDALTLTFPRTVDWGTVSAIQIIGLQPLPTPTPTATLTPTSVWRINCGGTQTVSNGVTWLADAFYNGGLAYAPVTNIISGTNDPAIYQTYRGGNGGGITYILPVPTGTPYIVALKFSENGDYCNGSRKFNVYINSATVTLSNFDICTSAGGPFKALDKVFTGINPSTSSAITIRLTNGTANSPAINAIQVVPQWMATAWRINAGGYQYKDSTNYIWLADSLFSGGAVSSTSATITGAGADQPLYQYWRETTSGGITYTMPVTAGTYAVTLLFSENSSAVTAIGQRVFNVFNNGSTIRSNFDIYASAGGRNKTTSLSYSVTLVASGGITVRLVPISGKKYPAICAVQVKPTSGSGFMPAMVLGDSISNETEGLSPENIIRPTPTPTPTATETPTPTPTPTPQIRAVEVVAAPNVSRDGEPIGFKVALVRPAEIQLTLVNVVGERVYQAELNGQEGENTLNWDLTNQAGSQVASGMYIYVIQVDDGQVKKTFKGKIAILK